MYIMMNKPIPVEYAPPIIDWHTKEVVAPGIN